MISRYDIWFYVFLLKIWYGYDRISNKAIYSQFALETGEFKSRLFIEFNNPSGMKLAKIRDRVQDGEYYEFATYRTVWRGISDYFKRQKYFRISRNTDSQYMIDTVNSGYGEEVDYLIRWENVYIRLFGSVQ
jgi:hypothetical protein